MTGNDLLKQSLFVSVKHDGSKGVFPVIHENPLGVSQCGVGLIGGNKFAHVLSLKQCDIALVNPVRLTAEMSGSL